MSQLLCSVIRIAGKATERDLAGFEMVFSELLDSAAVPTAKWGRGWLIEALFHDQPDLSVATPVGPIIRKTGARPVPLIVLIYRARLAGRKSRRISAGKLAVLGLWQSYQTSPTRWCCRFG